MAKKSVSSIPAKTNVPLKEAVKGNIEEKVSAEKPFEEQLTEAVSQSVEQFYTDLLKKADSAIKGQAKQIADLNAQQIAFRDEVALACYVPLIDRVSNHDQAANDAFRAADAFLRAREGGIEHMMVVNPETIDEAEEGPMEKAFEKEIGSDK
jgi:hypothetical protein